MIQVWPVAAQAGNRLQHHSPGSGFAGILFGRVAESERVPPRFQKVWESRQCVPKNTVHDIGRGMGKVLRRTRKFEKQPSCSLICNVSRLHLIEM